MSWISGNGFIPNDGLNGAAAPWAAANANGSGPFPAGSPGYGGNGFGSSDGVRPAWFGSASDAANALGSSDPAMSGGLGAMLAQFMSSVQQSISKLSSSLGMSSSSNTAPSGSANANGNGTASFQNVSLASTGDPHLSVSGSELNANGGTTSVSSKFDSMVGHADLFSTRDFGDGFHVSTTVTQPSSNGITQNQSATATMDGGRETVTMTNNGGVSVDDNGQAVALSAGQAVTLSGGQQVSEAANGAVNITESRFGENLTTTFTQNGTGGVDVTATGRNVTLGGALITGGTTPAAQAPSPQRTPYTYI